MSYIKIILGPLKKDKDGQDIANSNEIGLKYNNYGLEKMWALTKTGSNFAFVYAMIYGGYLGNCLAKEVEPEFSFEQCIDWVDVMDADTRNEMAKAVTDCMTSTQNYQDLLKKGKELEEKETMAQKKRFRCIFFDNLKFALGSLGWSARQYYLGSPYEFHVACEGYLAKEERLRDTIRFAAFRVAEAFAGSKAVGSIDKFWPVKFDEPKKPLIFSAAERREILNRFKTK